MQERRGKDVQDAAGRVGVRQTCVVRIAAAPAAPGIGYLAFQKARDRLVVTLEYRRIDPRHRSRGAQEL
jgi:hypothetical protein